MDLHCIRRCYHLHHSIPQLCWKTAMIFPLVLILGRTIIRFKILLLTHKALNGLAPAYISDLLSRYIPARQLRSSTQFLLKVPTSNLKTYGDRAFSVCAPKLWNSLPLNVKLSSGIASFKSNLKTYLKTGLLTYFIFFVLLSYHVSYLLLYYVDKYIYIYIIFIAFIIILLWGALEL